MVLQEPRADVRGPDAGLTLGHAPALFVRAAPRGRAWGNRNVDGPRRPPSAEPSARGPGFFACSGEKAHIAERGPLPPSARPPALLAAVKILDGPVQHHDGSRALVFLAWNRPCRAEIWRTVCLVDAASIFLLPHKVNSIKAKTHLHYLHLVITEP